VFAGKPAEEERAFEELEISTHYREEAVAHGDADGIEQANQQIARLETQISAPELKRIRAQLAEADRKRLETLRDFRIREARQAMNGLSDLEALSVLQDMKDAFPPWVWHEVVRRTQLRVNVADPHWDDPVPEKSMDRKDPATARWLAILRGWPREETVSVDKQGEKFEIVATAVVCNQLSEQAQHTYGKNITQGIRGAVDWYRDKAVKGTDGPDQPYFVRPAKEQDFIEGAGLFWAHFEAKKKPYKGNMAHPLSGKGAGLRRGRRAVLGSFRGQEEALQGQHGAPAERERLPDRRQAGDAGWPGRGGVDLPRRPRHRRHHPHQGPGQHGGDPVVRLAARVDRAQAGARPGHHVRDQRRRPQAQLDSALAAGPDERTLDQEQTRRHERVRRLRARAGHDAATRPGAAEHPAGPRRPVTPPG
jgi:hypothetical protein